MKISTPIQVYLVASLAVTVVHSFTPLESGLTNVRPPRMSDVTSEFVTSQGSTTAEGFISQIPSASDSTAVADYTPSQRSPTLSTWRRRLTTKQDAKNFHKMAGIGFTVTNTAILGIGAANGFSDVAVGHDALISCTYMFLTFTCVQAYTAIDMALKYRQRDSDKGIKDGFVSSAIATLSTTLLAIWASPFAPEFMDHTMIVECLFLLLAMSNIVLDGVTLLASPTVVRNRNAKRFAIDADTEEANGWSALSSYALTLVVPSAFMMAMLWRMAHAVETPRLDYLQDCANGYYAFADVQKQQSAGFYGLILSAGMAGYGSLATTLRDKKLITRQTEISCIAVVGVATLVANLCSAGILPRFLDGLDSSF